MISAECKPALRYIAGDFTYTCKSPKRAVRTRKSAELRDIVRAYNVCVHVCVYARVTERYVTQLCAHSKGRARVCDTTRERESMCEMGQNAFSTSKTSCRERERERGKVGWGFSFEDFTASVNKQRINVHDVGGAL